MYRPPFRQDRPHIATGVAADKLVRPVQPRVLAENAVLRCHLFQPFVVPIELLVTQLLVIPTVRKAHRRNLLCAGAGTQQVPRHIRSSE